MDSQSVASRIGSTSRTVTRIANNHKVGKRGTDGRWVFTLADAYKIGRIAKSGPGNPDMQNKRKAKSLGRKGGKS